MRFNRPIILASASPRRIDMMHQKGYDPLVMPAEIQENIPPHRTAYEVPMYLALKKGLDVMERSQLEDGIIISCDTIVYRGDPLGEGEIMGKPVDHDDGKRMLLSLRNGSHLVISGICMIDMKTGIKKVIKDVTEVFFGDYTPEELDEYLNTPEAYDKAGGYAIQGTFGKYVIKINGRYSNVVGFPWELIEKELELFQED